MSKKLIIPKANKAYGYVGVWYNGVVGWFGPNHIGGSRQFPDTPDLKNPNLHGERLFLCEITVKPLLDKKGRPITKLVLNK